MAVTLGTGSPSLIWGHGWGHSHEAFLPLAKGLEKLGHHTLIDFPGFGGSPVPDDIWGTADYAEAVAEMVKTLPAPRIWIGHSFGCRVGIQLAARHPDLLDGMVLMAAAGLKRKVSPLRRLWWTARVYTFKGLKKLIPLGLNADWLYTKFGSPDYRNAGPMRAIFVKTVNEDLTDIAPQVKCPVLLIYGENDGETPPEMGERFSKLILDARLTILPGQDHYSVLGAGCHQVAQRLHEFVKELK